MVFPLPATFAINTMIRKIDIDYRKVLHEHRNECGQNAKHFHFGIHTSIAFDSKDIRGPKP
jgi:hypothetical protein